jgi:NAD-dependent DNA ligase
MLQKAEDFQPHYIQKVVEPVAAQKSPSKRQSTSLFHGSLFAFIRISPPADVVDFDREELEHLSTSHGGRILSHEIIHALRMDKSNGSEPRTCFVVCWGSYEKSSLSVHSFVAQLMNEKLAEIVLVTPVWLQTCIAEQRQLLPSRLPAIFTPTCQPLRKVKLSAAEKSEEITTQLRVCVTGYTGFRRKAIQLVLEAMGAEYDETLRQSTSYLICKDASGSKYEKAREWKIHTVSIEWLYHIATVGWVAPQPGCPGCEAKFSIASE